MRSFRSLLVTASLLVFLGCGRAADTASLQRSVITEFNAGRLDKALVEAKDLHANDEAASDFLTGQIMIFTALAHGGAFSLLKPHYERMVNLDPMEARQFGSSQVLVARVFAQIYLDGRDQARKDLSRGCLRLQYGPLQDCVNKLTTEFLASYVASGSNMDRVYLAEIASIASRLETGDENDADYAFGISVLGVDNMRSSSVIRHMRRAGRLTQGQVNQYCVLAKSVIGADRSFCSPSK